MVHIGDAVNITGRMINWVPKRGDNFDAFPPMHISVYILLSPFQGYPWGSTGSFHGRTAAKRLPGPRKSAASYGMIEG